MMIVGSSDGVGTSAVDDDADVAFISVFFVRWRYATHPSSFAAGAGATEATSGVGICAGLAAMAPFGSPTTSGAANSGVGCAMIPTTAR